MLLLSQAPAVVHRYEKVGSWGAALINQVRGRGKADGGERRSGQEAPLNEFSLVRHAPSEHLLRSIDRFVDFAGVRCGLAPLYTEVGGPSIPYGQQKPIANRAKMRPTFAWVLLPLSAQNEIAAFGER